MTAYDVARFTREALASQVETLNPEHFPGVTESEQLWFIDFFAPVSSFSLTVLFAFHLSSSLSLTEIAIFKNFANSVLYSFTKLHLRKKEKLQ